MDNMPTLAARTTKFITTSLDIKNYTVIFVTYTRAFLLTNAKGLVQKAGIHNIVGLVSYNIMIYQLILYTSTTHSSDEPNKFRIIGNGFECLINKATGQILSLKKGGEEMINGGPWLMALPLTGGGCYPNHNAHTPTFNEICSDWKVDKINAKEINNDIVIEVTGAYKEFKGSYSLTINANGEFSVDYQFEALAEVNPRQWGLVFEAPLSYNHLFWRRKGMWNVYPDDHIGRTSGEALLKYDLVPENVSSRTAPTWSWSYDANELGSNDFRSTRKNIWFAGLKNPNLNHELIAISNGEQHWRSWKENQRIRFLVADFVSPGNEMFLESYYSKYRKVIKIGDQIKGTIKLRAQ